MSRKSHGKPGCAPYDSLPAGRQQAGDGLSSSWPQSLPSCLPSHTTVLYYGISDFKWEHSHWALSRRDTRRLPAGTLYICSVVIEHGSLNPSASTTSKFFCFCYCTNVAAATRNPEQSLLCSLERCVTKEPWFGQCTRQWERSLISSPMHHGIRGGPSYSAWTLRVQSEEQKMFFLWMWFLQLILFISF